MKDYTLFQGKITADFISAVFKSFCKVRFGIQATTANDNYDLVVVRNELLAWQLKPGTNKTLFSDPVIYPQYSKDCTFDPFIFGLDPELQSPNAVTPVIMVIDNNANINIDEIVDEIPSQYS